MISKRQARIHKVVSGLALSVRQPWATDIMLDLKNAEFRSTATEVRGRVWIYASARRTAGVPPHEGDPVGAVIGSVEIVDCHVEEDTGAFIWILRDPIELPKPVKPSNRPNPVFFRPW